MVFVSNKSWFPRAICVPRWMVCTPAQTKMYAAWLFTLIQTTREFFSFGTLSFCYIICPCPTLPLWTHSPWKCSSWMTTPSKNTLARPGWKRGRQIILVRHETCLDLQKNRSLSFRRSFRGWGLSFCFCEVMCPSIGNPRWSDWAGCSTNSSNSKGQTIQKRHPRTQVVHSDSMVFLQVNNPETFLNLKIYRVHFNCCFCFAGSFGSAAGSWRRSAWALKGGNYNNSINIHAPRNKTPLVSIHVLLALGIIDGLCSLDIIDIMCICMARIRTCVLILHPVRKKSTKLSLQEESAKVSCMFQLSNSSYAGKSPSQNVPESNTLPFLGTVP